MKNKKTLLIKELISITVLQIHAIEKVIAGYIYNRLDTNLTELPFFKIIDVVFKKMSENEILDSTLKKYNDRFSCKEIKELIKICSSSTYKKYQNSFDINEDIFKEIISITSKEIDKFIKK